MEDDSGERPFDERAVREQLEHLQKQIEQSRAQRASLQEQFDACLRRFDPPELPATIDPPDQRDPSRAASTTPAPAAQVEATSGSEPVAAGPRVERAAAPVPAPQASDTATRRSNRSRLAIAGAAVLVAASAATWVLRSRPPVPATSQPAVSEPEPAPPPAPVPNPAPSTESAIMTEQAVWLRVLVDGARVVEREVPAGTRLPLDARQSIAIRAGNAGAVRVWIRGEDQGLLGREGEVVTRTFTLPPAVR